MIAEIRLQWWRDALAEIAEGRPVRRHEVATPLAGVIDAAAAGALDRLVAARRADCYGDPFEDAAAFRDYLDETAGGLMWVAARALGAADPAPVRAAGQAAGLAGYFLAVPELAARGRQPLARLSEGELRGLAQDGLRQVAAARAGRARIAPAARVALLAGWRAPGVLARAAADPARILAGGLEESGARKSLTLMRAAYRGMI
jgi:phytoene/squalene synthetase